MHHFHPLLQLTNDPSVAGGGGNGQTLGHQETESGRIQVGAGANDTALGQTRQLPGDISQDIYGVGHDQQDGVRAVLDQLRDDSLENVCVALDQVQTALSGALTSSSCDDAQTGSSGDGKV